MKTINVTSARKILYQLVNEVNHDSTPIAIVNNKGHNAVLLSQSDWQAIEETLRLNAIPNFVESVHEASNEDYDACILYNKDESW